jgi:hypothetical protein
VYGGRPTLTLTNLRLIRWLRSNERHVVICVRGRGALLEADVNEGDMCSDVVEIDISPTCERWMRMVELFVP